MAVSFAAMTLSHGARNSFSVFYVVILDEFGWDRASTAAIFSINLIAYGLTGPLTGHLVDRLGPRKVLLMGGTVLALAMMLCSRINAIYQFYFLFGVAGGIGTSLTGYSVHAPVLANWFVRRRGMIFGILVSGTGASFLIIPLVQYLITRFGWRGSFILVGVLIGAILLPLVSFFLRYRPQDMSLSAGRVHSLGKTVSVLGEAKGQVKVNKEWISTNWTVRRAIGTYQLWLLFFVEFAIFGLVKNLVVVHQIALMRDAGFSIAFAASITALLGVMTMAGNLGGFLSDRIGRERAFSLGCLLLILGLLMLLLVQKVSHGWMPYLYAALFGLGSGINAPVLGAAVADIFQGKNFGSINGFLSIAFGLGGILGPWFGGFIFDATGSYSTALAVAIVITCMACTFLWIAGPRKIREPA